MTIQRDRVSRISLRLYGISAGFPGCLDNFDGLFEVLIVISGELGNDIDGMPWSDLSLVDHYAHDDILDCCRWL